MTRCLIGLLLFDMPHSALNCAGAMESDTAENGVAVKTFQKGRWVYPYVSAQAVRYWWRSTLARNFGWKLSPISREKKIAFTAADPYEYEDDDVFGYMRAEKKETVTRLSPLKCSPLISIAPHNPTHDFGVMARHEGDPVPFETQFYSTIMRGAFSLDLDQVGAFGWENRTGYLNIDESKKQAYMESGAIEEGQRLLLPQAERVRRATEVLQALPYLSGGAKQTLFLTDVVPKMGIFCVIKGGNHPLMHVVREQNREICLDVEAFKEALVTYADRVESPVWIGRTKGFMEEWAEPLSTLALNLPPTEKDQHPLPNVKVGSFKDAVDGMVESIRKVYMG